MFDYTHLTFDRLGDKHFSKERKKKASEEKDFTRSR
jgi:hypothetical protein